MSFAKRWAFMFSVGFLLPSVSHAYCRMTTCQLQETPENPCERAGPGAESCISEGVPTSWPSPCLDYAIQVDGSPLLGLEADQVLELVREAFSEWERVECPGGGSPGFQSVFQGFVTCNRQQVVCGTAAANVSTFIFYDQGWPEIFSSSALGGTRPVGSGQSGILADADIAIQSPLFLSSWSREKDDALYRVLVHEIGHFLGLSHSDRPGALMSVSYQEIPQGDDVLTDDDRAGICAIFPPLEQSLSCTVTTPAYDACAEEEVSPENPCTLPVDTGSQGCQLEPGTPRSSQWSVLAGLGVAAWSVRRRRLRKDEELGVCRAPS